MNILISIILFFSFQTNTLVDYKESLDKKYLTLTASSDSEAILDTYKLDFVDERQAVYFIRSNYQIKISYSADCTNTNNVILIKEGKRWFQFKTYANH